MKQYARKWILALSAAVVGGTAVWFGLQPAPTSEPTQRPLPAHLEPLLNRIRARGAATPLSPAVRRALRQAAAPPDSLGITADASGAPVARTQGFSALFHSDSIVLTQGDENWVMSYQGIHCGSELRPPRESAPRRLGEHVVYTRGDGLDEWYAAGSEGLEQGFTFSKAPCASGQVVLALALTGTGSVRYDSGESALYLASRGGTGGLRYGDLYAYDSTGDRLPATLEYLAPGTLQLRVHAEHAAYPIYVDPWVVAQSAYIKASNTGDGDSFGYAAAVDRDTIVIGARRENSNATGIDGNQSNNTADDAGAAYVFVRSGGNWRQQAYLKASNSQAGDVFGHSVAIDGDTIVIGATGEDSSADGINGSQSNEGSLSAGAAYVFVRSDNNWTQQAYLKASASGAIDLFGSSVAVEGDTIVVGAYGEASNATGIDGNQSNNSMNQSGAAYVFVRSDNNWTQQAYLKASNTSADDKFGETVALDGDTAVIGARHEDSNTTGIDGNQSNNSMNQSGAAYVFVRSDNNWTQQAYVKASNTDQDDEFGGALAIEGDTLAVGARYEDSTATGVDGNQSSNSGSSRGAAYVFARRGGVWTQQGYLKASNSGDGDEFGNAVAIDGNMLAAAAHGETSTATGINGNQSDDTLTSYGGAVYVFSRRGNLWRQEDYVKASNTEDGDIFGYAVAMDGDVLVVGATSEDSSASGVNGDESNNSTSGSGAAYTYRLGGFTEKVAVDSNTSEGNCSAGGKRILIGDDDGAGDATADDDILGAEEIDETHYVCNGATGGAGASGPSGASGSAGTNGTSGATGPSGPSGATGPAGAAGNDGSDGADGGNGPSGPSGATGPAGADGPTGPSGPSGAAGQTCTLVDNGDGTRTVTCPGGESIDLADGSDGADGKAGGCSALPDFAPLLWLAACALLRRGIRARGRNTSGYGSDAAL